MNSQGFIRNALTLNFTLKLLAADAARSVNLLMLSLSRLCGALLAILCVCFVTAGFSAPTFTAGTSEIPVVHATKTGSGGWFSLKVSYKGQGKLSYRWYRDGRLLNGLKGKEIRVGTQSLAQQGAYTVEITDSADGVVVRRLFFIKLAAPKGYLLGLGDNSHGQAAIPASLLPPSSIHAFAAGGAHSLAVSDGWVHAWGDNSSAQCTIPYQGSKRSYTVAAGAKHSLALLEDGTVRAWGDNSSAQCDVPASLGIVRAIAAGGGHSLAIKLDGTVAGWGENGSGQLTVPSLSSAPVAIAAGHDHSLVLLANGEVLAWGANDFGQCEVPPKLRNIVSIGAAGDASFAVTKAGRVHVWGDSSFRQSPAPPKLKPVASAMGGWDFIAARLGTGGLSFWGDGAEDLTIQSKGLAKIYALAAGGGHVLALRDGKTDKAPRILSAPLPPSTFWDQPTELTVSAEGNQLSYQWYHNGQPIPGATKATYKIDHMRLEDAGAYSVRVLNGFAHVHTQNVQLAKPGAIPALIASRATAGRQRIEVGDNLRIEVSAVGAGNLTYQWRHNGKIIPGETSAVLERTITTPSDAGIYVAEIRDDAVQVVFPSTHVVVPPLEPVQIVTWGNDSNGQTQSPEGIDDAIAAAAGAAHSLALRSDGTVVAWGDNRAGQCTIPDGLTEVVAIAAIENRSAALTGDGIIWTWGGGAPSRSLASGRNDLTRVGLSASGVHVFADATAENPSVTKAELSETSGTAVIYRIDANGRITAQADTPTLPFGPTFGEASRARSAKSVGSVGTMPDYRWGHVPFPNSFGYIYEPYQKGITFSALSGHVSVLTTDGIARFWDTKNFFEYNIPNYSTPWAVSYPVTRRPTLDQVSHISTGGDFRIFVRAQGGVGGLGENPDKAFAGIPWRLSGVRALISGGSHTIALCEGSRPSAPRLISTTTSRAALPGERVRLKVEAEGQNLRYQWSHHEAAIPGANAAILDLGLFTAAEAGSYTVRISDGFASVESEPVSISTASAAPVFEEKPATRVGLREGERLELRAVVSAPDTVSCQWLKDGVVLPSENSTIFLREKAGLADAGRYTLRITGADGAVARATSHVFVLPASGTRLVHEKDSLPYPSQLPDWTKIRDAVDFLPFKWTATDGLVLRLDGTVSTLKSNHGGDYRSWIDSLSDVVALSAQAVLLADGTLSARPGRTLPSELASTNIVGLVPGENLAVITEDGRLGVLSEYGDSIHWLPAVGEPAFFGAVRFDLEHTASVDSSVYEDDYVIVGEDGGISCTLPAGLLAFDPTARPARILSDLDGGVSAVSADASVYPCSYYGLHRPSDPSLTETWMATGSTLTHVRITKDGTLRRWKRGAYRGPWEETPVAGLANRKVLKAKIASEKVMALCVADETFARIGTVTPLTKVFAGNPLILAPELGVGSGMSFIWEHNGRRILGANHARIEKSSASSSDSGWYRLRAIDSSGVFDEVVLYVLVETPGTELKSLPLDFGTGVPVPLPPPGIKRVVDFFPGVALLADGSFATWPYLSGTARHKVPAGLKDLVRIVQSDSRGCALSASGHVSVWNLGTGKIEREWDGALWLQSEFMLMRDGSVRTYEDGKIAYAQNQERGAVIDITRGRVDPKSRLLTLVLRQDGSLTVHTGQDAYYEPAPVTTTRAQLGGSVIDMRINFGSGLDVLVATDAGPTLRLRSNQAATVTDLRTFDAGRKISVAINNQGTIVNADGSSGMTGAVEAYFPWVLCTLAENNP